MAQGPYGMDPGRPGYTLEPQGIPVRNFFAPAGGWGPQVPFGPAHPFGPGPIANIPMYADQGDRDAWPQTGPANPAEGILPPMECPQPCPTTVRQDLCVPQGPSAAWRTDPFGDPAQFVPPGVRTVPEYTPVGVKSVPGGSALVGPGGQFVFPTPKLPRGPRGAAVPAGEVVGLPGAIDAGRRLPADAGVQTSARFRIPWWGWAAAALLAYQVVGR